MYVNILGYWYNNILTTLSGQSTFMNTEVNVQGFDEFTLVGLVVT